MLLIVANLGVAIKLPALVQIGLPGRRPIRVDGVTEWAGLRSGFSLKMGIVAVEGIIAIVGDVILSCIDEYRYLLVFAGE